MRVRCLRREGGVEVGVAGEGGEGDADGGVTLDGEGEECVLALLDVRARGHPRLQHGEGGLGLGL
eukprot:scaffold108336_cov21-Phaeocystis_antarctica.AAC.1